MSARSGSPGMIFLFHIYISHYSISELFLFVVPSPVRNLEVLGKTTTSVSLSWLSPAEPNGNVSYRVFHRLKEQTEAHDNLSKIVKNTEYTVTELHEHITYVFTVQPFTKRGGNGEKKTVETRTEEAGMY